MKKRDLIIPIIFLFVLVSATFSCALVLDDFNEGEIPKVVSRLIGNQRINVYLDEDFTLSVETTSDKFYLKQEEFSKPTLEIFVDSETLKEIANSENPQEKAIEAYNTGKIRIVKKTFLNRIRFFFANLFFRKQISGAVVGITRTRI